MIDPNKTCRILSIDGGGIRGLIPATILSEIEKRIGGPIAQHFHMIAGTSTGGILATGLAAELTTQQLLDFYHQDGPKIFTAGFASGFESPKYDPAALEAALKKGFGALQLSDLQHDLLVTAYDITARKARIFQSWKARGVDEPSPSGQDFLLTQVTRSTSAAPTYFPAAMAVGADGAKYPFVDGGMFANNPALVALVCARRLMPLATRYMLVSIGTGEALHPITYDQAKGWGLLGWGPQLIDVIFDAAGSVVSFEIDQMSDVSHLRLQTSLAGASEAMDDASPTNLKNLEACAARTLVQRKQDIDPIIAELRQYPLPSALRLGYPSTIGTTRPAKIKDFPIAQIQAQSGYVPAAWGAGGAGAGALAGAMVAGPPGALIGGIGGLLVSGGLALKNYLDSRAAAAASQSVPSQGAPTP